ncbi:beta tubulin [Kluyveromyces marxianus]|nr:beta tubulin [Kluyveromyces marxianus]
MRDIVMLRNTVLSATPCIRTLANIARTRGSLPKRNQQEDDERISCILNVLNATKYELILPPISQLRKCLYISKSSRFKIDSRFYGFARLELEGSTLLKSEFIATKSQLNVMNMRKNMTSLQKAFMTNHRTREVLSRFLRTKGVKKLARFPLPHYELSSNAITRMDLSVFYTVVACLAHCNEKTVMSELIQNEITKPAIRKLFRL